MQPRDQGAIRHDEEFPWIFAGLSPSSYHAKDISSQDQIFIVNDYIVQSVLSGLTNNCLNLGQDYCSWICGCHLSREYGSHLS